MFFYVIRYYLLFVLYGGISFTCFAQSYFMCGAREAGMANSILTAGGASSIYHNPAGFAQQKNALVGLSYESRFQLNELSTQSLVAILPIENGGFGTSYSYFGTGVYNEQKFTIGYAHVLGEKIDAGVLFDLYSTNLPYEYESDYAIAGEIGVIVYPINQLSLGVHLNNLSNSSYFHYKYEELGAFLRSGITWTDQSFLISGQLTISKHKKPAYSFGTEITIVKNLNVRAGISNEEFINFTFGLGYKQKRWRGDVAFAQHPILGYSSFLTLELVLGKLNK